MRKSIFLCLLTIVFLSQLCAQKNHLANKLLLERKTFSLKLIQSLDVFTSGGSISVEGTSSGEAVLEVYVDDGNGKNLEIRDIKSRLADNYDYETGLKGNTLFAKAVFKNQDRNARKNISISYKVIVPIHTSSKINTNGGSIIVQNLQGQQAINTNGGSLSLSEIHGSLDANTSGGSIRLQKSSGELKISTAGGSLSLDDLKGVIKGETSGGSIGANHIEGDLQVVTAGGGISLKNISATTNAETSGGAIDASFLDIRKGIKLLTAAGSIHVEIPQNKGFHLQLKGNHIITTNIPISGTVTKTYIEGNINGGGNPIKAETAEGSIHLSIRK